MAGGRAAQCYSRPGRELLRHHGFAWLCEARWPVPTAVLDGDLYSGDGMEGIDAILQARGRAGSAAAIALFDVPPARPTRRDEGTLWPTRRKPTTAPPSPGWNCNVNAEAQRRLALIAAAEKRGR